MQPKVIISECAVFPIFDFFAYLFFPVVEEKSRKMLPLQSPRSGPTPLPCFTPAVGNPNSLRGGQLGAAVATAVALDDTEKSKLSF